MARHPKCSLGRRPERMKARSPPAPGSRPATPTSFVDPWSFASWIRSLRAHSVSRLIGKSATPARAAIRNGLCAALVYRRARCVTEIRDLPHGTRFSAHDNDVDVFWLIVWRDERVVRQFLPRRVGLNTLVRERSHHHVDQVRAPKLAGWHFEVPGNPAAEIQLGEEALIFLEVPRDERIQYQGCRRKRSRQRPQLQEHVFADRPVGGSDDVVYEAPSAKQADDAFF